MLVMVELMVEVMVSGQWWWSTVVVTANLWWWWKCWWLDAGDGDWMLVEVRVGG